MNHFRTTSFAAAAALLLVVSACQEGAQQTEGAATDTTADTTAATQAPTTGQMLDPNTASRDELITVPGLDAALADSIIANRSYDNMLQVDTVLAGRLNEQQRDSVYTRMFKPVNINTASDTEMMVIPGVGDRMVHEFKEYRPWTSQEQFRREIGKYVDDTEVERLLRHVTF